VRQIHTLARAELRWVCEPASARNKGATVVGYAASPAFRQRCTGTFSQGVTSVVVRQDNDRQLTLTFRSQPTYKLRPYRSRTFVIDELAGFRVEFHLGPDGEVDELFLHQPNGTFVARRGSVAGSR